MSWVISRRLLKSGGNNISWRIGNYNQYSSEQCQTLRKIYTSFPNSKRYKRFVKNINQSLYDNIDRNIYEKTRVYSIQEYTQFWGRVTPFSMDSASQMIALRGQFRPCLNLWSKYYTDKIADKIFRRCAVRGDILTKYNNEGLEISADKMFSISIENIINKYQRYKSFSNIEPDYYGWKPDLFRSCQRECSRRWEVELLD